MRKLVTFMLIGIFIVSCSSGNGGRTVTTGDLKPSTSGGTMLKNLAGKEYVLTNMFEEYSLTLGFESNGRVHGFSGVNRFMSSVIITGDKIKMNPIAGTKMAGPSGPSKAEKEYLDLLSKASKIELSDETLEITTTDGKVLEFYQK